MVYIHNLAQVLTKNIGDNTKIWQFVVVLEKAYIGKNCNICSHCFIENDVFIGDNVTIKNGVYLWDGLIVEDSVFIGPNVTFTNDLRPRSKQYPTVFEKTIIKKGVSIGANATILCGITIGKWAMIGAGSVVTKSIPAYTLFYGNPAKFRGYICKCGNRLHFETEETICNCGRKYILKDNQIKELTKKDDKDY